MKKTIRHYKKLAEICRFKLVCPLTNHVPNLHYKAKTDMAAIVNKEAILTSSLKNVHLI